MKKFAFAAALAALLGAGPTSSANAEVIDRIAARVNTQVITLSDLVRLMPVYLQVVGVSPERLRTAEGRNEVAIEFLDYLVDTQLLIADAATRELGVTDAEVNDYVEAQRARLRISAEEFAAELGAQGITIEDFREFMRGNLTRARLMQLDVSSQVTVSPEDIDREIAVLYPDGLVDTYITTSHVLVQLRQNATDADVAAAIAQADALRAEIVSGREFADVAAATNSDGSRNTGGRIGSFNIHDLDQDYVREALALDPGEISEPVRTQFGVHLILMHEIERRPVADADEIRARTEYDINAREAERQMGAYLRRLRDDAFVDVRMAVFEL